MKITIRSSFVLAMFAALMLLGVTSNSAVSAQGWHSAKPATPARPSAPAKPSSSTNKAATSKTHSARRGTSKTRQAKPSTAAAAATTGTATTAGKQTQNAETATTTSPKGSRARRVDKTKPGSSSSAAGTETYKDTAKTRVGRCDPDKDERVDLSGTYKGQINYPAAAMAGEATLTVNGNRFTLEAGSKTEMGNFTAVSTCNYTAVAMMFGQWKTPVPGEKVLPPLPMLSLTAVKKADRLSLKPSPSEHREFSFETLAKK